MRQKVLLIALSLALAALPSMATDDPHGQAFNVQCVNSCHNTHTAAGGTLTIAAGNENVCFSCHNITGGTATNFLIDPASKASLATHTGKSHAWNAAAVNSNAGANNPSWTQMLVRLDAGNIICSTCHNQHSSDAAAVTAGQAGTQYGSNVDQTVGTGNTVTYNATAVALPNSYIIEITTAGTVGNAQFRYSKDGEISWFGPFVTANNYDLEGDSSVTVSFPDNYALNDKFLFYVGYPFLRMDKSKGFAMDDGGVDTDNVTPLGDKFCRVCHADWVMNHTAVGTWDNTFKSHPTGVTLNVNAKGYDRGSPLEADGTTGDDGNATNDLKLDSAGRVQCYTCHGVHHADGNSQTVDTP